MAVESFGAIASLINCFCRQGFQNRSLSKQCSYLDKPESTLAKLDEQMKVLNAREADIRQMLSTGMLLNGMQPKAEVKLWLENVEKLRESVNQIKEGIVEDKRCLIKCFPNCCYRLKLGNVVDKKIDDGNNLLELGKFSESALVGKLPERGKTLPATSLRGETAERNLQGIWDFLMDERIRRIGIYGMGGVGKTTIMVEINNRLVRENACFDNIIWVTATREGNLQKLQKDIAKALGLNFDNDDDEMTRAANLLEAFMRQNKFLLVIDDLWEAFPLERVGFPTPEQMNSCKLVITTRSLSVCRGMETMEEVEIEVLSSEEAWDLFKQKVGGDVVSSTSMETVAKNIANECGGLPLAICTVGRALRKENNVRQWENALRELKNSTASLEGMENQVFARLRFSYDRLKDDINRSCFLYAALYPEDHQIEAEELIRYWVYEGLLGGLGEVESKMRKGYVILDELKHSCLLDGIDQDGNFDEYVKMHDLIRDMAIALTRVNPLFMIRAGQGIRAAPDEDEWLPNLERVSLMRNGLSDLNCEPRCPKLSTLLLQYNSISKGIDNSFFNHIQNLKVLDLSYTGIANLPDSLSNLQNLRALLLCSCWNLHYVPTLANLKELRVLDLSYSSTETVPDGMEMLVNLRRLHLSYCKLKFPVSLLPKYKVLENLMLLGLWQSFDPGYVHVLTNCINLSLLEANFSTLHDFNDYILSDHWGQLESFKFCIGYPQSPVRLGRNSIGLFGVRVFQFGNHAWLPGRILELELRECSGIDHLPVFITAASSQLRRCKIQYCDDMEWIIRWSTLPSLEWLHIEGLRKLKSVCKGIPLEGTLTNLKVFHLSACHHLKTLFPFELVQNLKNLQEIVIQNCERIEEIIASGTEEGEVTEVYYGEVSLPGLQKMRLSSLPWLRKICSNAMSCDSLSTIEVLKCPRLRTLPFFLEIRQPLICSLKQIKGSRRWRQALEYNHPNAIQLLHTAFKEEAEDSETDEEYMEDHYAIHSIRESASSSYGR